MLLELALVCKREETTGKINEEEQTSDINED